MASSSQAAPVMKALPGSMRRDFHHATGPLIFERSEKEKEWWSGKFIGARMHSLSLRAIEEHFGQAALVVATTIPEVRTGRPQEDGVTLEQLFEHAELNATRTKRGKVSLPLVDNSRLRLGLSVLVHHNIVHVVRSNSEADGDEEPTRYVYLAREALMLLRRTKFALLVERMDGLLARAILTEVMLQGRVSAKDACKKVSKRAMNDDETLLASFEKLLRPDAAPRTSHSAKKRRKNGPCVDDLPEGPWTYENEWTDEESSNFIEVATKRLIQTTWASMRDKRILLSCAGDAPKNYPNEEHYVRANYEYFAFQFRIDAAMHYFQNRYSREEASVLKVLLGCWRDEFPFQENFDSIPFEEKFDNMLAGVKWNTTRPFTTGKIKSERAFKWHVGRSGKDESPTLAEYIESLHSLARTKSDCIEVDYESVGMLKGQKFPAVTIHIESALEALREGFLFQHVEEDFGQSARRAVRLIALTGALLDKQVAEKALIAPKEARKTLYTLHRQGILGMREISKNVQYLPAQTFYLFNYDKNSHKSHLREKLAGTIERLLRRNAALLERNQDVPLDDADSLCGRDYESKQLKAALNKIGSAIETTDMGLLLLSETR